MEVGITKRTFTPMTKKTASLTNLLEEARQRSGLSLRELATRAGIPKSTVIRLWDDQVASPKPNVLEALATALSVEVSDLYAAAGYTSPDGLPSFNPYLRRKYGDLPEEAKQELETSFARIAKKYGYDGDGPEPGEDEN